MILSIYRFMLMWTCPKKQRKTLWTLFNRLKFS